MDSILIWEARLYEMVQRANVRGISQPHTTNKLRNVRIIQNSRSFAAQDENKLGNRAKDYGDDDNQILGLYDNSSDQAELGSNYGDDGDSDDDNQILGLYDNSSEMDQAELRSNYSDSDDDNNNDQIFDNLRTLAHVSEMDKAEQNELFGQQNSDNDSDDDNIKNKYKEQISRLKAPFLTRESLKQTIQNDTNLNETDKEELLDMISDHIIVKAREKVKRLIKRLERNRQTFTP